MVYDKRPQARHRRARARRRDRADRRSTRRRSCSSAPRRSTATWLLMRSATRRVARRARQQLGRARPQPDGPPLPLRRQRHGRRARGSQRLRPPADRLLHPALPQPRSATSATYLRGFGYQGSASRQGWQRAVARARRRRRVQGRDGDARAVADRRHRRSARCCRTTPTAITIDETKKDKWGLPVLAIDCATGENERLMRARHDERHGRDARGDRRQERARLRQRLRSRAWASTRWARRAWAAIRRPRC